MLPPRPPPANPRDLRKSPSVSSNGDAATTSSLIAAAWQRLQPPSSAAGGAATRAPTPPSDVQASTSYPSHSWWDGCYDDGGGGGDGGSGGAARDRLAATVMSAREAEAALDFVVGVAVAGGTPQPGGPPWAAGAPKQRATRCQNALPAGCGRLRALAHIRRAALAGSAPGARRRRRPPHARLLVARPVRPSGAPRPALWATSVLRDLDLSLPSSVPPSSWAPRSWRAA
jgi:hypothetical protein